MLSMESQVQARYKVVTLIVITAYKDYRPYKRVFPQCAQFEWTRYGLNVSISSRCAIYPFQKVKLTGGIPCTIDGVPLLMKTGVISLVMLWFGFKERKDFMNATRSSPLIPK